MVEYDPFIKSQLASRNQLHGLMWRTLDHVTFEDPDERDPRPPPCGVTSAPTAGLPEGHRHTSVCETARVARPAETGAL